MLKVKDNPGSNDNNVQPNFFSTSGFAASQINALLHQGVREVEQNHHAQAQAYFNQVLKLDSNNELALLWSGYITEDPNEAMGYLDRVLRLNPRNTTARRYYDLALAQARTAPTVQYEVVSRKSGHLIPWLGDLLLEIGTISQAQLQTALARQEQLSFKNKWKPLGEILIQLSYVNRQQLDYALNYQKEKRA